MKYNITIIFQITLFSFKENLLKNLIKHRIKNSQK